MKSTLHNVIPNLQTLWCGILLPKCHVRYGDFLRSTHYFINYAVGAITDDYKIAAISYCLIKHRLKKQEAADLNAGSWSKLPVYIIQNSSLRCISSGGLEVTSVMQVNLR